MAEPRLKALLTPGDVAGAPLAEGLRRLGVDVRRSPGAADDGRPVFDVADGCDIYHFWGRPEVGGDAVFGLMGADVAIVKAHGGRAIYSFAGADLRDPEIDRASNPYSPFRYGHACRDLERDAARRACIAFLENHIDRFLTPDPELRRFLPEADILPHAIDLTAWRNVGVGRTGRPLAVYAAANPLASGAVFVEAAVQDLRDEGLAFDFRRIAGMPQEEAMAWRRRADIVIDQLHIGAYSVAALEAMALGKPVICYLQEDLFRPAYGETPIVNANPDTIKSVLRRALGDADLRIEAGQAGRRFVETHHDAEKVARRAHAIYRETLATAPGRPAGAADVAYLARQSLVVRDRMQTQDRRLQLAEAALRETRERLANTRALLRRERSAQGFVLRWSSFVVRRIAALRSRLRSSDAAAHPIDSLKQFVRAAAAETPADVDCIVLHGVQLLPMIDAVAAEPRLGFILDCIEIPSFRQRSAVNPEWSEADVADLDEHLAGLLDRPATTWTVSDALAAHLRKVGARNVTNLANYRDFAPVPTASSLGLKRRLGLARDQVCILSLGLMATACDAFLEALAAMAEPPHFIVCGRVAPAGRRAEIEAKAAELGLAAHIHIVDPVAYGEIAEAGSDADLAVVLLDTAVGNNAVALPNRVFDYLAAGLPVVTLDIPDIADILARYDAGIVARANSADAWRAAIETALRRRTDLRAGVARANAALRWDAHLPVLQAALGDARHVAIVGAGDLTRNNRSYRMARDLRRTGCAVTLLSSRLGERRRFDDIGVAVRKI